MEPKPPITAAANAFRPTVPRLVSIRLIGASMTPATVATAADSAQTPESTRLTGIPMQ